MSVFETALSSCRGEMTFLKHAGPTIRTDVDYAKKAIEVSGSALQYFSEDVRRNQDIALAAVLGARGIIQAAHHIASDLLREQTFGMYLLSERPQCFRYFPESVRSTYDVAMHVASIDPFCFSSAKTPFSSDVQFAMNLVRLSGDIEVLRFFPDIPSGHHEVLSLVLDSVLENNQKKTRKRKRSLS
jgi:hypothetical protein